MYLCKTINSIQYSIKYAVKFSSTGKENTCHDYNIIIYIQLDQKMFQPFYLLTSHFVSTDVLHTDNLYESSGFETSMGIWNDWIPFILGVRLTWAHDIKDESKITEKNKTISKLRYKKKSSKTHSLSANEPTTVPNTMEEPNPTTKSWLICLDVIP